MEPQKTTTLERLSVPIAVVIAGALIAVSLYFANTKSNSVSVKPNVPGTTTGTVTMRPVTSEDWILGNPNAELIIVEYSDTECPYCKQYHSTLRRVMDEYGQTGKVAWVYRHFPIDSLHAKARKEAEALECAGELGGQVKFWEYTHLLYQTTPSNDGLDLSELPKMAKTVGLDVNAFNTCLSSGRHAEKVQRDYDDAVAAGGRGTPNTILITKDGTKTTVQGAQPYENMKNIVDAVLGN